LGQAKITELMSNDNLKQKFIERMLRHYKSLQKAFMDINKSRTGYILFSELKVLINGWGFDHCDEKLTELFNWMDNDKD
jgi:Ca2+-binding EF-hand superfamily protein